MELIVLATCCVVVFSVASWWVVRAVVAEWLRRWLLAPFRKSAGSKPRRLQFYLLIVKAACASRVHAVCLLFCFCFVYVFMCLCVYVFMPKKQEVLPVCKACEASTHDQHTSNQYK